MYCIKCGKELPESAQFCPNCGNSTSLPVVPSLSQSANTPAQDISSTEQQSTAPASQQNAPPLPKEELKCPKCGADGCLPQYKQNVSGGGYGCLQGCLGWLLLGPFGLLCGSCGKSVKSTNNLVWICPKCGHEFKKPPSREEIYARAVFVVRFCGFGIILLALLTAISIHKEPSMSLFAVVLFDILAIAVYVASSVFSLNKLNSYSPFTDEEKQKLKKHAVIAGAVAGIVFLISILVW